MKLLRQLAILLLLAAYPILFLYSRNLDQTTPGDIGRALAGALLLALVAFLLHWRPAPDSDRAVLSAGLLVLLFFSFGHVYWPLRQQLAPGNPALFGVLLLLVWLGLYLVGSWFLWRRERAESWLQFVLVAGVLLNGLSLLPLLTGRGGGPSEPPPAPAAIAPGNRPVNPPDIFFVVLDGYGRADVLQTMYGYDNTPFINFLEERGFFVAAESVTNYNRTVLSLAATTNLDYIDRLNHGEGAQSTNYAVFDRLIADSRARQFLEAAGYETVVIASGYGPTEIDDGTRFLSSRGSLINGFERLVLRNTPLGIIPGLEQYLSYEAHRRRVLFALDELERLAREESATPRFVFAHVIAPHPPFLFAADGTPVTPDRPYYLGDADNYRGSQREYIDGYAGQLHYLNQLLTARIAGMLDGPNPPVIILQGDHGPGGFSDFSAADASCLYERAGILNAVYVPPAAAADLPFYDGMSPVNTFRLLFDGLWGTELGVLPDRSYFGAMPHLFDPVDVTARIGAGPEGSACQLR